MYSFKNDYSEGAHPKILDALIQTNGTQEEGYGMDTHTQSAINKIKELIGHDDCDIHLIPGGTMTNLLSIAGFLRPHEACIAATTGHIATHETGAIEATGHKIVTVESSDGKLKPSLIAKVIEEHHFEHMVKPRLVYISNPTELGTVYSKKELESLYEFCEEKKMYLYCDGARLGSAIVSKDNDVTLEDMYKLTDGFFIGCTKLGALMGEALILKNCDLREDFRYLIKQRGALLSKGRVMGVQINTLFTDGLYFDIAKHETELAQYLASNLRDLGCDFLLDSQTNQIFPIMDNEVIELLNKKFEFYTWKPIDQKQSAIRLITSWATQKENVDSFLQAYKELV